MKTLKLVSALTAVLLATACGKSNQNGNPNLSPAPVLSGDGGIEGGGGGTLIVNPIGTYRVRQIVQQHKVDIRLLLNGLSKIAAMEIHSEVEKKLFLGRVTILDLLEMIDVEIRDDRPCYDASGEKKDASIHAIKPNTICLSAFRIAPKVIEERAKTEILALVIHELTHFLGTTEAEAVAYQKWCAALLAEIDEKDAKTFTRYFSAATQRLAREINQMAAVAESATDEELMLRASAVSDAKQKIGHISDNFMHALHYQDDELLKAKTHVLSSITLYAATLRGEYAESVKNIYDKMFASSDSLTVNEYLKAGKFRANIHGDKVRLQRITSRKELKAQLDSLKKYYDRLAEAAEALLSGAPIPKFDDVI